MRDYNIQTEPVAFLDILELRREEEVNRHGGVVISGHITDEQEEEYTGLLTGDVWEVIRAAGPDGEEKIVFAGIVTDYSITAADGQRRLTLEVRTGSCLMDVQKHFRSFQDPSMTYAQIYQKITGTYADSALVFSRPDDRAAAELVLQYWETDWEFIRRLAGRSHQYFVPDPRMKGVRLYYSMPQGQPFEMPEGGRYTARKDLDGYRDSR